MVKLIETSHNPTVVADPDPGYGQLFAVLWRRRLWLVGVFGTVLAVATLITLRSKPVYESSMQLQVEPNYQGKKEAGTTTPESESQFADSNIDIDYATQLNVMRSSMLLQKAVDLLSSEYPKLTVDEIRKSLVLTQVQEDKVSTKIVKAVYTDHDPVKSQKVLKALRYVYGAYNREQQKQRLDKGLEFIDRQLPQVEGKVIQAEAALERFRESQNLIDPTQQATAISEALNAVQKEQQSTRIQIQDTQARYKNLQLQISRSPQNALISSRLSQSTRYQALLNELQKTELALAQARLHFQDAAPSVQLLQGQRQDQLKLLQQEQGRVLGAGTATQLNTTGVLTEGQMNGIDLTLSSQLAEAQTNLLALESRDRSLAQTEQQLRGQLNRFPGLLSRFNHLQPEVQLNRETLQQLLKAQQELGLEIARGGYDWQVLEEPKKGTQIGPSLKRNLLLGAVVGSILGAGAAFLREMIDDAVHTSAELEKQSALPLLGMTPELPQNIASEPPLISLPFGQPEALAPWTIEVIAWPPSWEALDLVYKNIQLLSSTSTFKSLMITSALPGEGKSTLALSLAISAARLHKRVLLIDADLRRPNLHKQLNLPNEQGLSTLLTSRGLPHLSRIQSTGSYIDILTSGPIPTDPANLLSSQRMGELMATFEQNYDLVILDAPPVLGLVDAILAGSFCDGVVLAARIGRVTRAELTQATTMLSKLNVIGIVANAASSPSKSYLPYAKQQGSLSLRLHQPLAPIQESTKDE